MVPKPLYEILPFAYGLLGLLAALNVDPSFGRLSGVALLMAGIHIFRLRRAYRQGEWKR